MKKIHKIIIGIIASVLILVLVLTFVYFDGQGAVSSKDEEVIVEISGSNASVLDQLDKAGLIKNKTVANIYLKLNSYDFIANTYVLNKNMDLPKICQVLEGDKDYISAARVTILDGYRITDCATQVGEALEVDSNEVLAKWSDSEYLNSLIKKYWFLDESILNPDVMFSLEGYFAPETYIITASNTTIEDVTEMMLDQTDKNLSKYKDKIASFTINGNPVTIHQFLTFASIVQCEASGNQDDQEKIAGVFINRLEKPMRLQSDVTVNYANQIKTVAVTYKDLNVDSKYNTYYYDGLPVGPISNVSNQIIESCLNYQDIEAMFFFALEDGTVIYSNTYDEHLKVVSENKWY